MEYREPRLEDGTAVFDLVSNSPPLDVNSRYAYFLLCSHFAKASAVCEDKGRIVGFLGGYRLPEEPEKLFVWQVVTDAGYRGKGLAPGLLNAILANPANRDVRYVTATVGPSNVASKTFFEKFAQRQGAAFKESPFLEKKHFGGDDHEEEILLTIGPIAD